MSGGAHALAIVLAAACTVTCIVLVRRRQLRGTFSILWLATCVVIVVLALAPGLLDAVAEWLGIAYPPALLFFGASVYLFFVAVAFSWELSRLEERTRALAETVAVLEARLTSEPAVAPERPDPPA